MEKVLTHRRYTDAGLKNVDNWNISDVEKKKVLEYVELYRTGSISGRVSSNPDARIERLLQMLRVGLENFKPTKEGIENFKNSLFKGKIKAMDKKTKTYTGKPYSIKTIKGIIETLKTYIEWRYPDKTELSKPLDIKITIKENDEYETFSIPEEADKLRKNCGSIAKRGLFALLMSGARIEELFNITEQDIKLEGSFPQITIRNKVSKTKGRCIKIYYAPAMQDLHEFIQERKAEGMKPNEPLITIKYLSIHEYLLLLGKKTLNKKTTPHTWRHSVATLLANKFNRQELCYYFGWKFSSTMPDKYINRNGFNIKEADVKIESQNIQELKDQLSKSNFENKIQKEEYDQKLKTFETELTELKNMLIAQSKAN